jgi:hypothetical protein
MDQSLVSGVPLRNIAEQFGTSPTALHRHKAHLPQHLTVAKEAAQAADADVLLDTVKQLFGDAQRLTALAEQAKQLDTALRGIREMRGVLELMGRLSGELTQRTNIAIGVNAAPRTLTVGELDALPFEPEENERRINELLTKCTTQ